MIFEALHESSKRGELLLVSGGFCHWHLRQDGQLTIHEIISTRRGAGSLMLRRLMATPGATSLFAKCPAGLPANEWYTRRGFHVEQMERTKRGDPLICWRMDLKEQQARPQIANVEFIYCGNASPLDEIALDQGFLMGSQLPKSIAYRPYFADQDWRAPDRAKYMAMLAKHRPHMATVLDWERVDQLGDVLSWAEEAARYVSVVIIIPKVHGGIAQLPRKIGGKAVRLGYSVPTRFAGTDVPLRDFAGWPVHLLGGSPEKQLELARMMNVRSADQNYCARLAVDFCQYWIPGPKASPENFKPH